MPRLKEEEILELIKITPEQVEKLDYETAMAKLEMVTGALEQEGTPLALGLKLYELGTALSRKCAAVLDSTEEKMLQLLGDIQNQSEAPFDPEKDGR